ncbi:MAG TPA: ATP-binding protein, partial [Polyangiales bacterium]|nr:ATP-binding protein [Polyangiales bacterium]
PADIDLNDLVSGLQKMLRRLISEDIELLTELGASLGLAHADPGQIEQVILNLCVNARDAMPEGGTLLISTACMHIDGAQHRDAADTTPVPSGCYVRLSVCDTGTGMDEATRQRIFEPFFTTKGLGKGTGLGLSTCYGIVKQSGGFIEVDSTPGRGTAFYVYLPCSTTTSPSIRPANPTTAFERGDETVLLVEDDDALRRSLARALKVCGYSVILASCGSQARMLLEEHADDIDLLLSDVVLPDESGLSIAGHARTAWPKIHTMLMSGHTDHALLENQPLRVGEDFLQKPFSPADLALKVRRVLDA